MDSEVIKIVIWAGAAIGAREVYLHIQVTSLKRDVIWIKKLMNSKFNKNKENQ